MKKILFLFASLGATLSLFLAGCSEPATENEYTDKIIVTGYLIAGNPVDSIIVSRTLPITQTYTSNGAAMSNAIVIITSNGIHDTLHEGIPGRYSSTQIIHPKQTYSLYVRVPDGRTVTGITTVPDTFHIEPGTPDSVTYGTTAPTIAWTESALHADYIATISSLDMTETVPIQVGGAFGDSIEDYRRQTFTFGFENLHQTDIPWFAFHYYGKNALIIYAADKNYSGFFKQIFSQTTDIQEFKYNLKGGVGVFGSASISATSIVVKR